jgi:hypothetical protein
MKAWPRYLAQAKALTKEEREAVLMADAPPPVKTKAPKVAEPPPAPAPIERKARKPRGKAAGTGDRRPAEAAGSLVRWTSREWCLVARAAQWVAQQSPSLSLAKQVNEAQVWTLPADRLRPYSALVQSFNTRKDGQRVLALKLADGLANAWTVNTVPFNPPGSEPEKTAVAEAIEELASPPVGAVPETARGPGLSAAPATGGALPSSLSVAAQAFGATMMQALDALLSTHTQHLLGQVNERIGLMAQETGSQVAAMIEAAMRRTVHSMVEQELGGPVSPPVPPADEPASVDAVPIPGEAPPRMRLKVDVVGTINPPVRVQVRDAFANTDVDLRFFEGSHHDRYTPDPARHCIFMSKRSSHGLFEKLKKYKVKPIYVEPSAGVITHAIEELQRSAMQ